MTDIKKMEFSDETGQVDIEKADGTVVKYNMADVVTASTNSSGGLGILAGANGLANIVTPGGYAERVVTAPTISDNRIVAVDYLPYLPLAENSAYILARDDATAGGLYRVKKSDGTTSASVLATALY